VDEAMCMVNDINQVLGKDSLVYKLHSVTVGLEIKFLKPVPVPGVIRVMSWTEGIEGRKTRLRCEVKDGEGNVFAKASSMWVALDPKL
jgi:acyl-CoA thioesterase FadM